MSPQSLALRYLSMLSHLSFISCASTHYEALSTFQIDGGTTLLNFLASETYRKTDRSNIISLWSTHDHTLCCGNARQDVRQRTLKAFLSTCLRWGLSSGQFQGFPFKAGPGCRQCFPLGDDRAECYETQLEQRRSPARACAVVTKWHSHFLRVKPSGGRNMWSFLPGITLNSSKKQHTQFGLTTYFFPT